MHRCMASLHFIVGGYKLQPRILELDKAIPHAWLQALPMQDPNYSLEWWAILRTILRHLWPCMIVLSFWLQWTIVNNSRMSLLRKVV